MKKFRLFTLVLFIGTSLITYSNCMSYCSPQLQYFGSYAVQQGTIPDELINRYEIMQQFCNNQHVLDNYNDFATLEALVDSLLQSVTDFNDNFKDNFNSETIRNVIFPLFSGIAHQINFTLYDLDNILPTQSASQNYALSNNMHNKLIQCWQIINSLGV